VLARQIAEPFPAVTADSDALEAARLLAEGRLPGLIVTDADGHPRTVLPGSQVLRFVIPNYVQDDPPLARAYDEATADRLFMTLAGKPVRTLLPRERDREDLPIVDANATVMEVAAVMARMHSPVVAVVDKDDALVGAITVSRLLDLFLPAR
jgi:CBS domain-containing protein